MSSQTTASLSYVHADRALETQLDAGERRHRAVMKRLRYALAVNDHDEFNRIATQYRAELQGFEPVDLG